MTTTLRPASHRIASIDIIRGLVMVMMALDHTREFFHSSALAGNDPLDFATTSPLLFLTRWITHFCAPIFVFLSGTSIYLYARRVQNKNELARFLFTRGLWLVFAELVIVNGLWFFSYFRFTMLQVFYAIGMSMICMSLLQYLPRKVLIAVGLLIVLGHNMLAGLQPCSGAVSVVWSLLFSPNLFQPWTGYFLLVGYPFVSWLGIMICGYAIGRLFDADMDAAYRKKVLLFTGIAAIALFIILRFAGVYGDRVVWAAQATPAFTFLDFLNTTKYPPSLQYSLMTIGPALIGLALVEPISNAFTKILVVYGRVPFVYYMLHVFVLHVLALINSVITHHGSGEPAMPTMPIDKDAGHPLWAVYLIWISVVIFLYFPSRRYAQYRAAHPEKKWLRYL